MNGSCTKIMNTTCMPKRPIHTAQIQIRLLLRSSLIWVLTVCYSDKHFLISSPDNQQFIRGKKEKTVQNFRTFTVQQYVLYAIYNTVKPVENGHSRKDKKLVFNTNYCLMQVNNTAILSTFINLPFVIKIFVLPIFEGLFYTGFTVHECT